MKKRLDKIAGLIARRLFEKSLNVDKSDRLSDDDCAMIERWRQASDDNEKLYSSYESGLMYEKKRNLYDNIDLDESLLKCKEKITYSGQRSLRLRILSYAALIFLPLVAFFLYFTLNADNEVIDMERHIIAPGKYHATLSMSDGSVITLGDSSYMVSDKHTDLNVSDTILKYSPICDTASSEIVYNTIKIPVGGEYAIELSDGTRVKLNSLSTLTYPVSFDGLKSRDVYLSGEAWFDVAKNENQPFNVLVDDMRVRVYGTSFNINTYDAHRFETVLVSGSVSVKNIKSLDEIFIKPSQKASFDKISNRISVEDVDVSKYIGWKDGLFIFEEERLFDILKKLALWYDVQVEYEDEKLKLIPFTGYLKRYAEMNVILEALEMTTSVKFDIVGERKIVVKR